MYYTKEKLDKIKGGLCVDGQLLPRGFNKIIYTSKKVTSHIHILTFFYDHTATPVYHCENGPSTIYGGREGNVAPILYEFNGFAFTNTKDYCYVCGFDDETTMLWLLKYGTFLPTNIDNIQY